MSGNIIEDLIEKLAEQYPNSEHEMTVECFAYWLQKNAAPVVERQPVAYVLTRDDEVCYEADDGIVISNTPGDETNLYKWKPVYFDTSPPAPVAQDEMVTLFKDILGWADSNTTWSEIECRIRACLDKVKELNS